ncbi:MAG: SPOR domain-containing protein [Candidatus Omnitrophica bacterium]|nr:SPOR domain-containing protein [Candidatus Omnitrophota bacterium]
MTPKLPDRTEQDLFGDAQAADRKIRKKTRFLLPRIKKSTTISYENVIFLSIGFVMSCIIFFSLGVEKGRRDVNHVRRQEETSGPSTSLGAGKQQETREEVVEKNEKKIQTRYIIQLAAFKGLGSAKEEQVKLEKAGYAAGVRKSGDYYQVYISGFNEKQDAQRLLGRLKEKYGDCYIIEY